MALCITHGEYVMLIEYKFAYDEYQAVYTICFSEASKRKLLLHKPPPQTPQDNIQQIPAEKSLCKHLVQ